MAILHQDRWPPGHSLWNPDLHLQQGRLPDDQQRRRALCVQRRVRVHDPGPLGGRVHQQPEDHLHPLLRPLQAVGIVLHVAHQGPLQEGQPGQNVPQRTAVCRQPGMRRVVKTSKSPCDLMDTDNGTNL